MALGNAYRRTEDSRFLIGYLERATGSNPEHPAWESASGGLGYCFEPVRLVARSSSWDGQSAAIFGSARLAH